MYLLTFVAHGDGQSKVSKVVCRVNCNYGEFKGEICVRSMNHDINLIRFCRNAVVMYSAGEATGEGAVGKINGARARWPAVQSIALLRWRPGHTSPLL